MAKKKKKQQPIIKLDSIENLKKKFPFKENLSLKENISLLGHNFVIDTLQNMGLSFDFTISKTPSGKPYFINNEQVCFNISNNKDYIAIAIHNKSVGIDIEYLRKDKQDLVMRYFHPMEQRYLFENKDDYDWAFTQLWTIKEAFVKMKSTGIDDNFSKEDLSPKIFVLEQAYEYKNYRIISHYDSEKQLFISVVAS